MLHILKIEWLKIKKYPAFWWMFGIVALTYPGINLIFFNVYNDITKRKDVAGALAKQLLGNPFAFPETWHSVAYFSSWFVMIPSILVIMVITNEYTYKTHRQNIIDGMSRQEFMLGKMIDVAIIAGVATIMCALVATGFGIYTSKYADRWAEQLHYIPVYVPAFVLKLVLGEMSIEVLKSATVSNKKILAAGFHCQYPSIQTALQQLFPK